MGNQGRKYQKTETGRDEKISISEHPTKPIRKSDRPNSNAGNVNENFE